MTDEFKKSTDNLKKAVPLMMKNQVATTPANYALWYTYVDNTFPEMNQQIDDIVQQNGLCPPSTNDQLYQQFIASKAETSINDLKTNLEVLVGEISSSMTDTLTDTSLFSSLIDKSFSDLERVERDSLSLDEVMSIIRKLIADSREIRHSTTFLHNQLNTATNEITRLKNQLAEVQKDALFDSLTSLYNRRAFDRDIHALFSVEQPFSLIVADIDHFKSLNDTYGHLFGDAVIRSISKRMQNGCREGITAYRFGGEEFVLLVPQKSLRIGRQFAESLRRSIEKLSIKDRRSGQQVSNVTVSFGVAERVESDTAVSLLERADKMLYDAKKLGRNRVMPL
ncbi:MULTISPECIES: GGDEF domain-containing protein [Vibrio]|uniref:diguanylate cyclase n=2 Tax=Vibrio TaxID=662 RepID=A0A7X4LHX6_9VIBR|nr:MULTISPECIES: GGDEF domain-containing protein [Vibrio]MBF9003239.1 GGDEF domain-containing protein [Vibrio nitrifigilis]MZI91962.1 diguanylate cyclase [Vibrio eleionomae]